MHFYNPDYFYYKGQHYGSGTSVILKDEYIKTHTYNGKRIWKTAMFNWKINQNNIIQYSFNILPPSLYEVREQGLSQKEINECASAFRIDALMLEDAIEEITQPIHPPENVTFKIPGFHEDMTPVRDWEVPGLMVAWVVFIMFLVVTLAFKEWRIIWPIAGFVFDRIRNEMLSQ